MDRLKQLEKINTSFQHLLSAETPAPLPTVHVGDELLVRLLLGGKDVGKSTFLNTLLGQQISTDPPENAEGTSCFVAYVHTDEVETLERRFRGLSLPLRIIQHQSEVHRHLCLVDSPDFDSRYLEHAGQVQRILEAGVADGVVLMASPAKYKDQTYWQTFSAIAERISQQHILFVLTKADELGR